MFGRILWSLFCFTFVVSFVIIVPNLVLIDNISAKPQTKIMETRGPQEDLRDEVFTLKGEMAENIRRIDDLEKEKFSARIAVLESRVETMFELGRIVLGAAVLYLIQFLSNAALWVAKRANINLKSAE